MTPIITSALQADSNFKQIGSMLSVYLNLLGDDDQSIDAQAFLDANSYPVPDYTNAFAQAYNALDLGVKIPGVLDVSVNLEENSGIPYNCGCLKKN